MAFPRDERIARQDLDDGDDDDTVWLKTNTAKSRQYIYHDTLDCCRVKSDDQYTDNTRSEAQRRWKAPCLYCVVGDDPNKPAYTGLPTDASGATYGTD